MDRYFLHLRDDTDEMLDAEGMELSDLKALEKMVLESARDLLSSELKSKGVLDLRCRIEAENRYGEVLHTLAFKDAFIIIPEPV